MKKLLRLVLTVTILLIPAIVFGQGSGSSGGGGTGGGSGGGYDREDKNFAVTRSVTGKIVGLKKGILTFTTKKDVEIRVALTSKTKFKRGKETLKADELEESLFAEGQEVKVTYLASSDDRDLAEKIATEVRFVVAKEAKQKPTITE
jgi:hypothetical protein